MVSVSDAINSPRLPSIKAIMGAKKKPLETSSALPTPAGRGARGRGGPAHVVRSVAPPVSKAEGVKIEDSGGDSADKLVGHPGREGLP